MVINTIIAILLACATSAIVAPLMIKFAFKVGAVDVPKDERKIQESADFRLFLVFLWQLFFLY